MTTIKSYLHTFLAGFFDGLRLYRDIFVVPAKALIGVFRDEMSPAGFVATGSNGLRRSGGHVVVRRTSAKATRAHVPVAR